MDSNEIFNTLKSFLVCYEKNLSVIHNTDENYYLNTITSEENKKSEFFGAVQVKKSYVAYHLMPIYCYPELLDNISHELKNKMQGKSCFNFQVINDNIFKELNTLTISCFEKYKQLKKV